MDACVAVPRHRVPQWDGRSEPGDAGREGTVGRDYGWVAVGLLVILYGLGLSWISNGPEQRRERERWTVGGAILIAVALTGELLYW